MATSTLPENVEKRSLQNTPMYISRVQSSNRLIVYCLIWEICRFRKLKKEIRYKTDVPRLRWCLSLYKEGQTLYVKVVVPEGDYSKIECYMICAPRIFIDVQETGRYEYQIPFETIEDPKNKLIWKEDKLSLEFRFAYCESIPAFRPFFNTRSDTEMLESELRDSIIRKSKFEPNFTLRLRDAEFCFRKDILAARCKFFYDYFKQNPDSTEYEIHTTEKLIRRVGFYLLFGHTTQPTELEPLMEAFMLAVFMKIRSLQFQYDVLVEGIVMAEGRRQRVGRTGAGNELLDSLKDFLRKKQELRLSGKLFV